MQKVGGARRAPRRRFAVGIVIATMLALAGVIALAAPAYAHWVSIGGDCEEVVVRFHDFNTPTNVHTNVVVEDGEQNTLGTRTDDTLAEEGTPPARIDVSDLTSQSPDGRVKLLIDVDWVYEGTPRHDDNHIHLDCGGGNTTTSVSPTTAENSTTTTPPTSVSPTSAANTTTTSGNSPTTAGNLGTTTTYTGGPVTTAGGSNESPTTEVTVAAGGAGTGSGGGSLPFTGGNSIGMLIAGLALIVGGAAAVIGPRYRRRSAS
jgi:hypothetical protein